MKKINQLIACAVLAIAGMSFNVSAQEVNHDIQLTADVQSACSFTATDQITSSITGLNATVRGYGVYNILCNNNLPYSITTVGIDDGVFTLHNADASRVIVGQVFRNFDSNWEISEATPWHGLGSGVWQSRDFNILFANGLGTRPYPDVYNGDFVSRLTF